MSSILSALLEKLHPKFLGVMVAVIVAAGITYTGIALVLGYDVKFGPATLSLNTFTPVQADEPACFPPSELRAVGADLPDSTSDEQLRAHLQALARDAERLRALRSNFLFQVLELEMLIPRFGTHINVRVDGADKQEVFEQIQLLLREVGYFDGGITGEHTPTLSALQKFQQAYNERTGYEEINPSDFGLFGYRTLEAIRRTYRLNEG